MDSKHYDDEEDDDDFFSDDGQNSTDDDANTDSTPGESGDDQKGEKSEKLAHRESRNVFRLRVIVMMVLPMPPWVLDIGLAMSFGLAILIFTVTLFLDRPLDFSSFPTILLASLMLRLSLIYRVG